MILLLKQVADFAHPFGSHFNMEGDLELLIQRDIIACSKWDYWNRDAHDMVSI